MPDVCGVETRPVPGTRYSAGADGEIYREDGTRKAFRLSPKGYRVYTFKSPEGIRQMKGHRMVAMAWHGPPPFPGAPVDHRNRVRDDNRPDNVRWVTVSENNRNREFRRRQERRSRRRPRPPLPLPEGVGLRPVPGLVGYQAGTDGRAYSCRSGGAIYPYPVAVLKPFRFQGHLSVGVRVSGQTRIRRLRNLIAEAFLPMPPGLVYPRVLSCNGDIDDTRPENLTYHVAPPLKGFNPGNRKLDEDDVRAIRARHAAGETWQEIARDYPVHRYTIRWVVVGHTWKDVV
jgi:hypothetical protein